MLNSNFTQVISRIIKDYVDNSQNIKNYVNFNDVIYKKLSNSYTCLHTEMDIVAFRLNEISECYQQLSTISEKTNDVLLTNSYLIKN